MRLENRKVYQLNNETKNGFINHLTRISAVRLFLSVLIWPEIHFAAQDSPVHSAIDKP